MDRNEYILKLAAVILQDWRKVLENAGHGARMTLMGDATDISYRALEKATAHANKFFIDNKGD